MAVSEPRRWYNQPVATHWLPNAVVSASITSAHCRSFWKGNLMHISYSLTQIRLGLFISALTLLCRRCLSLLTDSPPTPPSFLYLFHYPFHSSVSRSNLRELKNDEPFRLGLLDPTGYISQSLHLSACGSARTCEISSPSPGPSGLAIRRARGCPRHISCHTPALYQR